MTKYSPKPKAKRPQRLNEKTGRIANSLAETFFNQTPDSAAGDVSGDIVADALRAWRDRGHYLPSQLLLDPAWGILLELFHAEVEGRRVSVFQILSVSSLPTTTAIRWLKVLEERNLISRRSNLEPSGTDFVELTSSASAALRRYFREVLTRAPEL